MTRVEGSHTSSLWGSRAVVGQLPGVVVKLRCWCGGWWKSGIRDAYMSGPSSDVGRKAAAG
ncbi:hypothetical protein FNH08_36385 [Streptomyces spongiae]|uniref:Uncharacterized protein n=1 Tax=Streptomyces spongiae TaxID=565072 RepID=A0A5N8XSQ7_9ACTN|nr:hypothetical protein [Streptomyces spongiae]